MQTKPVLDQIETSNLSFRQLGGAESLAKVSSDFKVTPSAFVVMTGEAAQSPARAAGGYRQKITVSFSVVIVLDARKDDESDTYRLGIRDSLTGWSHPDSSSGALTQYRGWRLVPYPGKLIYEILFQTIDSIRR